VKDKLSDYLTEIKFHAAPSSLKKLLKQDKAFNVDTFTKGREITPEYLLKANFLSQIKCLHNADI